MSGNSDYSLGNTVMWVLSQSRDISWDFFVLFFSFLYAHLTTLLVLHPMVSAEIKPQRVAKQIIFDPDSVRANIQMFSFL